MLPRAARTVSLVLATSPAGAGATTVAVVAVVLVGYVLGSIPSAVLVARRRQVDIRAVGDRNPGYWNTKETLGFKAATPVLVVDAAKGMASAAVGTLLAFAITDTVKTGELWWLPYVGGLAAMVGHAWPLFAHFRGGRCVLTFVGAVVVINPMVSLVALGVCVLLLGVLRRFSLAARIGVFSFPVVQAFADPRAHVAMTGVMMGLIGFRFWQASRSTAPVPAL